MSGGETMTQFPATDGRIRISKSFEFSASHQLLTLPEEHKCARLHGHNYTVTVSVSAPALDGHGFVTDFANLAPLKEYLRDQFDHRHLNDVVAFAPTSELLAAHLGRWFIDNVEPGLGAARLVSMTVSETPNSAACWERH
ncbi:6-pyruvoyl trahydropterin synthase family protein [Nocardia asiatica]|uniref:6-pyruvoyl trahydropterin synthase family protein n=2 Tax=Nocardia TaxID=1817 RepID=UPI0024544A0C|nr:6-carboxytetrahydropterin synthase [Nocardia asiatica]